MSAHTEQHTLPRAHLHLAHSEQHTLLLAHVAHSEQHAHLRVLTCQRQSASAVSLECREDLAAGSSLLRSAYFDSSHRSIDCLLLISLPDKE